MGIGWRDAPSFFGALSLSHPSTVGVRLIHIPVSGARPFTSSTPIKCHYSSETLPLSYSHEYAHPHTNQWICDNYKFLRLAAIQFQIHSDHVGRNCYCLRVTEMSPAMIMYPSTLALYISHRIFFFFSLFHLEKRQYVNTFFCGWIVKKKRPRVVELLAKR